MVVYSGGVAELNPSSLLTAPDWSGRINLKRNFYIYDLATRLPLLLLLLEKHSEDIVIVECKKKMKNVILHVLFLRNTEGHR